MMTHLWLSEAFPVDGTPLFRRSFGYADDARELVARAQAYERRGAAREAMVAYDMALALIDGAPAGPFHADVLRWKGTLLHELGFTTRADALYRRSLAIAQNIGYTLGVAHAQHCLATVHQRRGQMPQAAELYRDATANALAAGDQRLATVIGQNLAVLATLLGDVDGARERYRASLDAFRAAGDDEGTIWTLYHVGVLATHSGRAAEAEAAFDEGLALARARGNAFLEGLLALGRAELHQQRTPLSFGQAVQRQHVGTPVAVLGEEPGDRLRRVIGADHERGTLPGDRVLRHHPDAGFDVALRVVEQGLARRAFVFGRHAVDGLGDVEADRAIRSDELEGELGVGLVRLLPVRQPHGRELRSTPLGADAFDRELREPPGEPRVSRMRRGAELDVPEFIPRR